jgi:hypothetical protein
MKHLHKLVSQFVNQSCMGKKKSNTDKCKSKREDALNYLEFKTKRIYASWNYRNHSTRNVPVLHDVLSLVSVLRFACSTRNGVYR